MPKFIKFISPGMLNIININDLISIQFEKEYLSIGFSFISADKAAIFKYESLDEFKVQCDAIMEQLEI